MKAPVLLIQTHNIGSTLFFETEERRGTVEVIDQIDLTADSFKDRRGIVTTMHLDQILFAAFRPLIEQFFNNEGRLVFMGHLVRPFLPELSSFLPIQKPNRASFKLTELADHPIFSSTPRSLLETQKGVAGFYGRGHVPPPAGATTLTGIGPDMLPVDWVWKRPAGGELFLHAGNNLWFVADHRDIGLKIAERIVHWCAYADTNIHCQGETA